MREFPINQPKVIPAPPPFTCPEDVIKYARDNNRGTPYFLMMVASHHPNADGTHAVGWGSLGSGHPALGGEAPTQTQIMEMYLSVCATMIQRLVLWSGKTTEEVTALALESLAEESEPGVTVNDETTIPNPKPEPEE